MFEESVVSIWTSMNSWLTPTVLFLLLNLMIGTIAIASSLGTQKHHDQDQHQHIQQQHQHHQGLVRSTSVLQRFKSINFYSYRSQEPSTNYEKAPESDNTHFAFPHQVEEPKLVRSPSILQRLQSIKFQFHFPREYTTPQQQPREFVLPEPEPEQEQEAHYGSYDHSPEDESSEHEEPEEMELDEDHFDDDHFETHEDEPKEQTLDEIYQQLQLQEHHVSRTTSDTMPASGEVPPKLPKKMKKSASAKSAFGHFAAEDIVESRRPATVREKKVTKAVHHEDDEEVDAKADDFINRFKQQLKLQRIDSIIRYKDMINRASDK